MVRNIARIISILLHPFLVSTIGFLILLNTRFYFSMLSWDAKRFVLLIVFFTTTLMPLVSGAVLTFTRKFDLTFEKAADRVILQLAAAIFYYLGYFMLGKINVNPVFKVFLIASALLIIILSIITMRWKISNHMAGIGGMLGTVVALSFRLGINPVWLITGIVLSSGLLGSSRLILGKHTITQVTAGFGVGFLVLYLVIYFI